MQRLSTKSWILGKGADKSKVEQLGFRLLGWMVAVSTVILFLCSSLRHALFQSSAWDLGIFDQAVYLISSGTPPISSFIGFHILGDHAALILYPLSLLYKIYPDVHWLLAVQAIALALGAIPAWYLARQAGLGERQSTAITAAYLLYPLVFNINLSDFHPETLALPVILATVWFARCNRKWWFCLGIIFTLSCRDALSLNVAAMGFWLLLFEKRRLCGVIAIVAGIAWLLIAIQVIVPHYGGEAASIGRYLPRYRDLGNSFPEIIRNLLLKPGLVIEKVCSLATVEYLSLLLLPMIWGLSLKHLTPLIGALPTLAMNILADTHLQRDLTHQYSVPVLPFLLLATIDTVATRQQWRPSPRIIILWSLLGFLALAKYGYFGSIYLKSLDTRQATQIAIAQIQQADLRKPAPGSVLTTAEIAPHLTHRRFIELTDANSPPANLAEFDFVLLNVRHPGWLSQPKFATSLVQQLKDAPEFHLSHQRDGVYLFAR
ncbi:MAG: DUF2079 domain-containing protein [Chroococcidiopsidaceae cyanobacterium CP_BM_ER_R8_30]|nr:DUF2079 domain-containing protein [Chroococcidiopsidaceae cyanobacterium CP_BM_ER_R8_30]